MWTNTIFSLCLPTHALQGNNAEKVWKIAMLITSYEYKNGSESTFTVPTKTKVTF
jgi:hypothetical protein